MYEVHPNADKSALPSSIGLEKFKVLVDWNGFKDIVDIYTFAGKSGKNTFRECARISENTSFYAMTWRAVCSSSINIR